MNWRLHRGDRYEKLHKKFYHRFNDAPNTTIIHYHSWECGKHSTITVGFIEVTATKDSTNNCLRICNTATSATTTVTKIQQGWHRGWFVEV
jgi:hypothetical protein